MPQDAGRSHKRGGGDEALLGKENVLHRPSGSEQQGSEAAGNSYIPSGGASDAPADQSFTGSVEAVKEGVPRTKRIKTA